MPIVVTHNPDESLLIANLAALLSQVQGIVLVDNNSMCDIGEIILLLGEKYAAQINLIKLEHNAGLGKAYNVGRIAACSMNATFVLLMDQDSIAEDGMISKLVCAYRDLERQGIAVGAVAPRYRNPLSSHLSPFIRVTSFGLSRITCGNDATKNVRADFLISSGSLIAICAFDHIGAMDEGLFIDHIDTEWCFRAQAKGFALYGVCDAFMQHSLGDEQIRFWWGRWRNISLHQSFRYYYIFRNSVLLWWRPYMPFAWKRADLLRLICFFFYFTLFSPNRLDNLRMMTKGLWDGINKRTGKLHRSSRSCGNA